MTTGLIRQTLQAATRDLHETLDAAVGEFADPAGYRRYLLGTAHFRHLIEGALTGTGGWAVVPLADALAQDLADLGMDTDFGLAAGPRIDTDMGMDTGLRTDTVPGVDTGPGLAAADRMDGNLRMDADLRTQTGPDGTASPAQALSLRPGARLCAPALITASAQAGALYVLEGSALGARILARRAAALGMTDAHGARHLALQTADNRRWRAFLDWLETGGFDAEQATEAARATFVLAAMAFDTAGRAEHGQNAGPAICAADTPAARPAAVHAPAARPSPAPGREIA